MVSLLDLFRAIEFPSTPANRSQLSDAVKQLAQDKGGIRGLSRFLQIPLTSLNRGLATNFATTRQSTLDRLSAATREQGVYFTEQRDNSTALDFTMFKPGALKGKGPVTLKSGRISQAVVIVYDNEDYLDTGGYASTDPINLGDVEIDAYMIGGGVDLDRIARVIYV